MSVPEEESHCPIDLSFTGVGHSRCSVMFLDLVENEVDLVCRPLHTLVVLWPRYPWNEIPRPEFSVPGALWWVWHKEQWSFPFGVFAFTKATRDQISVYVRFIMQLLCIELMLWANIRIFFLFMYSSIHTFFLKHLISSHFQLVFRAHYPIFLRENIETEIENKF